MCTPRVLQQVLEPKGIATLPLANMATASVFVATGFRTKGDCDNKLRKTSATRILEVATGFRTKGDCERSDQ